MKKVFKSAVMLMAAFMLPLGFTSCSSDDDPVENSDFTNKAYGQDAMDACDELCNALRAAYSKVNNANLSADQETYLKNVCANAVELVPLVPPYHKFSIERMLFWKSVIEL